MHETSACRAAEPVPCRNSGISESPLLAALAVLGVSECWMEENASEFTPALSETIKCARFMIVQKATQTAKGWDTAGQGTRSIRLDSMEPLAEEPTAA